jgi:hypothetical protein
MLIYALAHNTLHMYNIRALLLSLIVILYAHNNIVCIIIILLHNGNSIKYIL